MEKHKVIEAYRRGLITLKECGQILGAEQHQIDDILSVEHGRRSIQPKKLMLADNA